MIVVVMIVFNSFSRSLTDPVNRPYKRHGPNSKINSLRNTRIAIPADVTNFVSLRVIK